MGAFSVNREGIDRQAIQTAIDILASAKRPLIIFPEGGVTKTNDRLNALLEGVAFVARSSAKKRRQKNPQEKVVVHPIALKYLLQSEIGEAIDPAMTEIERRLAWRPQKDVPLLERVRRIGLALLTLKEMEYFAEPQSGTTEERLSGLVDRLLAPLEIEWLGKASHIGVIARVKALRMKIIPAMIQGDLQPSEERRRWRQLEDIYLAQQVASYPHDYIHNQPTVDRILETVERFQEDLTDETTVMGDLKIVIEVGEPITVEPQRDRAAAEDPLMKQIAHDLQEMLDRLARESPIWEASSNR